MFLMVCGWFDAWNTIEPGPTFWYWPLTIASSVPSLIISSSSATCWCGGCDSIPALSVVMCISSSSSVAVGDLTTSRRKPTFVAATVKLSQSKIPEPSTAVCARVELIPELTTTTTMAVATATLTSRAVTTRGPLPPEATNGERQTIAAAMRQHDCGSSAGRRPTADRD